MSYIRTLRNGTLQVMWRFPQCRAGKECSWPARSQADAEKVQQLVDASLLLGHNWQPFVDRQEARAGKRARDAKPAVDEAVNAYLADLERLKLAPATIAFRRVALQQWTGWVQQRRGVATVDAFDRGLVEAWHGDLQQRVSPASATTYARVVALAWRWASEDDRLAEHVPRPRSPRLPRRRSPSSPTAPTWAQCDAMIGNILSRGYRAAVAVARLTGLRIRQVLGLRLADLDLEAALLTIRPELGKTAQEQGGRIIPASGHLVQIVRGWRHIERETLIPVAYAKPQRARVLRAWAATGAPGELWEQRPHHCLRKAFASHLAEADVPELVIASLLGHSKGTTARHYIAPRALMSKMRAAVDLIPPIDVPVPSTFRRRGELVDR